MENIVVPALLLAGVIFAWRLTQWINWYSWGENQKKKKEKMKKMQGRGTPAKQEDESGNDDLP